MPAARIIPCLDVADGQVVKGVRFRDHRVVGDIVSLALRYRDEGADEVVFYDITASADGRALDLAWVSRVAAVIDIPFSVAGGIRSVETARNVLSAGADKVSINSPAIERPELLSELAAAFGRQCVVLGIDSFRAPDGGLCVRQYSGRPEAMRDARLETLAWARRAASLGAGEIVLNCMNNDGVRGGFDIDQIKALVAAVDVPVIASGGAGRPRDFVEAFRAGASGALAASIFHDRICSVAEVKAALSDARIEVRQ
jgi:cyclase